MIFWLIQWWHRRTFRGLNYEEQLNHFESEMLEWQLAFMTYMTDRTKKNFEELEMERADVIISGINLMRFPHAREIVRKKMNINKKRKWENGRHKEYLDK